MNALNWSPVTQPTQQSQNIKEVSCFESPNIPRPYAKLFVETRNDRSTEAASLREQAQLINLMPGKIFKCGRGHQCDFRLTGTRISGLHFSICEVLIYSMLKIDNLGGRYGGGEVRDLIRSFHKWDFCKSGKLLVR